MKVPRQLEPLIHDGLIDEVVRPLMTGKEAAVYLVVARGRRCCAKAYKDAAHRSFKNRASYQEGRSVRNSRQTRAMQKGSRYGKRELEEGWQNAEVDALYRLASAGVRVPKPLGFHEGVLLMELVADEHGEPAPRLNDVALTPETARRYHQSLLRDVVRMLCAGLVHGDLSEYNVLVDPDGPVVIDLPQAVEAAANNNAAAMLRRDVKNLAAYFGRFAPEIATTDYGREIWQLFERGELTPDTELTGRYQQSARAVNIGSVMSDIDDARRDAERRRMGGAPRRHPDGGRRKKKGGDEAWRGRVPEPVAAGDTPRVKIVTSPGGGRRVVEVSPSRLPERPVAPEPSAKKHRRRKGVAQGAPAPAQSAPDAPVASAKPARRRRRGPRPADPGPPGPPVAVQPEQAKAPAKTAPAPPQKPRRRRSRKRGRGGPAAE